MKNEYVFKKYSDLKNVVPMEIIEENVDFIYDYFMHNKADILYIMKDQNLGAVASPGDVHKFYTGRGRYEFPINKEFQYIDQVDYDKARDIFERTVTIHEVPVVMDGKFEGVIMSDQCKQEEEWDIIRTDLKNCKISKMHTEWLCRDLIKWKECFPKVKLFIYHVPSDKYLMPEALRECRLRRRSTYDERLNAEKGEGFTRLEYDKIHMACHNGIYKFMDMATDTCTIADGNRKVPNAPTDGEHRIFVFGACTMFGAYVDDTSTIEYFLQEKINNEGKNYQVCNCSMMGLEYFYHRMFTERMRDYDIVILALRETDFPYSFLDCQIRENFQSDLSLLFQKLEDAEKMFLACPAHCNDTMNQKIANVIFEDIKDSLTDEKNTEARAAMQDYYISLRIREYFRDFVKRYKNNCLDRSDIIGAVVMNCNPFTLGHRFLVESALKRVDYLYIFVVEEDRSFFSFEDRMRMVQDGVKDLEKVMVIPSGKYIISKDTFSQYFEKENVSEIDSMDYDARIFGEVVAPEFHISYRLIGEEPSDPVTNQYNATLKNILPQYGVKVEEIPRKNVEGQKEVINATVVRQLVQLGDFERVQQYCPESTVTYLKKLKLGG